MALFTIDLRNKKNFSLISGKLLKSDVIIYKVGSNTPFRITGITYPKWIDILSNILV